MENCIFCEIISKNEDACIIYENNYICCFLDKYPINKGHLLVVTKNIIKNLAKLIRTV